MMPSVHPDDEQLTAYVLGELPPEHLPLIAAHVGECAACVNLMQAAQATGELMRQVRVPVIPPQMRESILASFNPQQPVHVDPTPSIPIPVPPPVAIPGGSGSAPAPVSDLPPGVVLPNPFPATLGVQDVLGTPDEPGASDVSGILGGPVAEFQQPPTASDPAQSNSAAIAARLAAEPGTTNPLGPAVPFGAQPPVVYTDGTMSAHAETDQLNSSDIRNAGALRQPLPPLTGVTPGFTPTPRPQSEPVPAAQIFGQQAMANATASAKAESVPRARRFRDVLGVAASLTVIALCAGGAYYLMTSNETSRTAADRSAMGATQAESGAATADASTQSEGGPVAELAAGKTPVFETGVKYTASNLVENAQDLLRKASSVDLRSTGTFPVKPLVSKSTLVTDAGVAECMAAVDSPGTRPLVIDVASYEGEPAIVLILPGRAGQYEAMVVHPDCSTKTEALITYEPFSN